MDLTNGDDVVLRLRLDVLLALCEPDLTVSGVVVYKRLPFPSLVLGLVKTEEAVVVFKLMRVLFELIGNKSFPALVFGLVKSDEAVVLVDLKLLLSLSVTCFGL